MHPFNSQMQLPKLIAVDCETALDLLSRFLDHINVCGLGLCFEGLGLNRDFVFEHFDLTTSLSVLSSCNVHNESFSFRKLKSTNGATDLK